MIPAHRGQVVTWPGGTRPNGTTWFNRAEVEAWNDEGDPLIVGSRGLKCPPPGWEINELGADLALAAFPADEGWMMVRYSQPGDSECPGSWDEIVVGWLVSESGRTVPLVYDKEDGCVDTADNQMWSSAHWKLLAPGTPDADPAAPEPGTDP